MPKERLASTQIPPYCAYKTFKKVLTDIAATTVPGRIDSTFWGTSVSGSVQASLNSAFKFFGFIDDLKQTQPKLREVVEGLKNSSMEKFGDAIWDRYQEATHRIGDLDSATLGQLQDAFREAYGISGDILRKAVTFFIHAVSDTGVNLSPHILKKTRGTGIVAQRPRTRRKRGRSRTNAGGPVTAQTPLGLTEFLLTKFPDFDPEWPAEVQAKWFEALREIKGLLRNGEISPQQDAVQQDRNVGKDEEREN